MVDNCMFKILNLKFKGKIVKIVIQVMKIWKIIEEKKFFKIIFFYITIRIKCILYSFC